MPGLAGLRIVVTRAAHQAEELAMPLRELGAEVILLPVIGIGPPSDPGPLQEAALEANHYDWVVFTSQNGVEAFAAHWSREGPQLFRVAAIGRATSDAAQRLGFTVNLVPELYIAEGLVQTFEAVNLVEKKVLIPSAAVTRDVLPGELRKRGAIVTTVEAYRNVVPEGASERANQVFNESLPDWVLFASASAVEHLVRIVPPELIGKAKIATIGPATSNAVSHWGLRVTAEAYPHDVPGLVGAVVRASRSAELKLLPHTV